ncbi:hypothetical protein B0H15DRAFT_582055 [Mycena belliarum]|uniref:Uncharacterized protein n=1 Tax=Mycena belliarum TaxID=1033014 RepID=A0AAD6UGQ3_9AGAR|nr:hypothetical protein B0H15DRAFT_582055 [Mycena belliae]
MLIRLKRCMPHDSQRTTPTHSSTGRPPRQLRLFDSHPLAQASQPRGATALAFLGYTLAGITRLTPPTASAAFAHASLPATVLLVPAGPAPLHAFPFAADAPFTASPRFVGLLTSLVQAHALGWDVLLVLPAAPVTASSSTSTLVRTFGEALWYVPCAEVVHMYKQLGGRRCTLSKLKRSCSLTSFAKFLELLVYSPTICRLTLKSDALRTHFSAVGDSDMFVQRACPAAAPCIAPTHRP